VVEATDKPLVEARKEGLRRLGWVNVNDQIYDSGKAIAGATIGGIPIGDD